MTAEELFALPTNDRLDRRLIHGQLVERPYPFRCPAHAGVIPNLAALLGNWRDRVAGKGWTFFGYGCPYRLSRNPDTVLYYDASIVALSVMQRDNSKSAFIDGIPSLAIEVIDLNDPQDAILELVSVTLECGVPSLWILDPIEEIVEIHRPGCTKVILGIGDELVADWNGPALHCSVVEIFE
jgi:Uma2 family endonuclease